MSFWDAAMGAAADTWDDIVDHVSEDIVEPETGTFTPAPPQPDGPYDPTGVPTRAELLDFVDGFIAPVEDAMTREVAKEFYPGYASLIDMSKDEWEHYKDGFGDTVTFGADGIGSETHKAFNWYDEPGIVLPTEKGMQYYSAQFGVGPDPDAVLGDIVGAGEARAGMLVDDLRSACDAALESADLENMMHTARTHAGLYEAFDSAHDELSTALAGIRSLGQSWKGDDAEEFRMQYGDAVAPALSRHSAIALNLRRGADCDLAVQVALHFSIAGTLRTGQQRIDELSVRKLFSGSGISVLTAASITIGLVGLYPALGAGVASAIGLSGLAVSAAGASGADYTLNPKLDSVPASEEIREVMETMIEGVGLVAEDAAEARNVCLSELRSLAAADRNLIGDVALVPGSGY